MNRPLVPRTVSDKRLSHFLFSVLLIAGICATRVPARAQGTSDNQGATANNWDTAINTPSMDELANGFHRPPASAKPLTWWHWMNGNTTRQGITADLEAMKQIGEGGATIVNVEVGIPPGPAPFMSPEWQGDFKFAVQEADRLGLKLGVENCAGWSSSGGPWVRPQYAMQMVVFNVTHVQGPTNFDGTLDQPETRLDYYRDIEVLAYPTPPDNQRIPNIKQKADYDWHYGLEPDTVSFPTNAIISRAQMVNLTSRMQSDGHLAWHVPEGNWTILRIGYTPIGTTNHPAPKAGLGLECDKLSRVALDKYWAGFMQKILAELGPLAGTTLDSSLIDSYEVGAQNWTPRFREDFERLRGYDPLPWLPVLDGRVVDSDEASERFLWDVRRTVADLFAENYYDYFQELCHSNNLASHIEPYDGPYECIQVGQGADVPMGEFWYGSHGESSSCKLAASVGHIYGRQIIGAEAFTAGPESAGWQAYPYSLKALGDLHFAAGINRFTFHEYAMQPWMDEYPGMTMGPFGTELDRTITWWKQGAAWMTYLARCQYLLQQGRFVADVCYYAGDTAPNDAPHHPELKDDGYDYDACDTGVLLHQMTVRDGQLVLPDGMHYRVLVLPDTRFMTPVVLGRIRNLVQDGATVIGPKPAQSPSLRDYPQCDATVRQMADEVWGDCDGKTIREHAFGQGRIIWGKSVPDVLGELGVKPDCVFKTGGLKPKMAWIHRSIGANELYFLSNQRPVSTDVTCTFRVSGGQPEFWYPDTGRIRPATVWSEHDGSISIPIRFDPAGSVFVVFNTTAEPADHLTAATWPAAGVTSGPKIEIRTAVYEATDGAGRSNVTAQVAGMVADGDLEIPADNEVFGDPTVDHRKRLTIEYTLNGKPMTSTADEGKTIVLADGGEAGRPPVGLLVGPNPSTLELEAFENGTYKFETASGRTFDRDVTEAPAPIQINGPWALSFPPHWGAPSKVRLKKLIAWNDSANTGVRYFSGTAEYETRFEMSAGQLNRDNVWRLDLGNVKDLAEVSLNGHDLGVWWKPPFAADVTHFLHPGRNVLKVKVTNTWINRLIGDAQLPPDCDWDGDRLKEWPAWLLDGRPQPQPATPLAWRHDTSGGKLAELLMAGPPQTPPKRFTFTTWRHYNRDSKLVESGLLGPVVLQGGVRVPVE